MDSDSEKKRMLERLEQVRAFLMRRLKKLHARLLHHRADLASGSTWERETHLAELLKGQFLRLKRGMKAIEVEDWECPGEKIMLSLDPLLEPEEQLKSRFKACRKLKRRYIAATELIASAEAEITLMQSALAEVPLIVDLEALQAFEKKVGFVKPARVAPKQEIEKKHPFREFTTLKGRIIYVGKKDTDNEKLTFSFARGLDLWFHASNTPGSHVVLRVSKDDPMDEDSVQDALQLALYFSKARKRGQDDVVMTECKYLNKVRGGHPGQVTLSRHKTIFVKLDPKRLQRLLNKLL